MEATKRQFLGLAYPRLQNFPVFFLFEAENLHGSDLEAEKERRVENKKGCRRHRKKRTHDNILMPTATYIAYSILYMVKVGQTIC